MEPVRDATRCPLKPTSSAGQAKLSDPGVSGEVKGTARRCKGRGAEGVVKSLEAEQGHRPREPIHLSESS